MLINLVEFLRRNDDMGVPHPKGHSKFCVNGVSSETVSDKQSVATLKKVRIKYASGNVANRLFCRIVSFMPPFPTLIAYRNTPLKKIHVKVDGGAYGLESGNGQHGKEER